MAAHFDVLILGTGVPEGVLSAALSRAGKTVLHVDANAYYGESWASLSLAELAAWAHNTPGATLAFPRANTEGRVPEEMKPLDRYYSLSLRPTLLPSHGPMIEAVVRSNVATYATFRLLDHVATFNATSAQLERVPSNKSEIFKHKGVSLADKRRLMRFLQLAAEHDRSSLPPTLSGVLSDTLQLTPALQSALQYGAALSWGADEATETAFGRVHTYLKSLGKYGDGAYLCGQYGGAGELAQGFARSSAVHGGMFILGHAVENLAYNDAQWSLSLAGIPDTFTADQLAAPSAVLGKHVQTIVAHEHLAIFVTDTPLDWERVAHTGLEEEATTPETALLVFPPGSVGANERAVMVLMQGEGTFSCPKGQYVFYITTHTGGPDLHTPQTVLGPSLVQLETLLAVPGRPPILTLYTSRAIPDQDEHTAPAFVDTTARSTSAVPRSSLDLEADAPSQPIPNMTEILDLAVQDAEHAFWQIAGTESLREEARHVAYARQKHHDIAAYQGRGGAEPDKEKAPPRAALEFFSPATEKDEAM
ncbi:hypothetical protein MVES1_001118 [Malassezia vespertilionis]|uniref:Mrs6p n=1 Tax=Malassezia vespertilionis TaxID=2020962 RepID=A0A2N1JE64_9BASI|nr:uncharacterized protein MVES1_001118 [Malassezia vespertilionis]PKI84839.1 Mrs6p [Malassezia vespertilionis]WFD05784.1 hypothetical protein MVES1_001118 [Malassezia vespertilionis]